MRFTLKRKIISGLVAIVVIGAVSMLIVYAGLVELQQAIHTLDDVEAPTVGAAYEMEINVLGHGMAVLGYLDGGAPEDRARAANDSADFERFHAEYLRLAKTPRTRSLAAQVEQLHGEFRRLGEAMMIAHDTQDGHFTVATENLERIDDIIDRELQPRIQRGDLVSFRRLETLLDMEADIAEFWAAVANYRRNGAEAERIRAQRNRAEFEEDLATFKRDLSADPDERRSLARLERAFQDALGALSAAEAIEVRLQTDSRRFGGLREQIDDLLDEEIQVAALQGLATPRQEADRATQSIVRLKMLTMPTFLVFAAGVAFVLIRSIMAPVRRLMSGTKVVREGDLSHRIQAHGSDELSDLAHEFNRMVAALEATTVSKTALEGSEAQLRQANAELRAEISEREHAQQEQARLQAALKRSELLSVMGSLVAGVAHEVRNPLFGISSTLDALEARLQRAGTPSGYERHVQVLRGELERLRKFMQDLLEYGKAPAIDLADASVAVTLAASIRACQTAAERQRVTITTSIEPGAEVWVMDRSRIEQVVRNLLENAIQYSPRGGSIAVDVRRAIRDVPCLRIQVRDEGPGFDLAQLPRVFEPFFTRRRGGTGLGLSIVERIIEAHGGVIWAGNGPHGGAELTFELPLQATRVSDEEVHGAAQGAGR